MKQKIIDFIKQHEGGFAVVAGDRGGATCKGVTIATYRSVYGQHKSVEDLKRITDGEWLYIFDRLFWNKMWCDELPAEVACAMADWAFNSGVSRAVKYAQALAGVVQDGVVGHKTIAALRKLDKRLFVAQYLDHRRRYYLRLGGFKDDAAHLRLAKRGTALLNLSESNSDQKKFVKGWLNRVNQLEKLIGN